MADKKYSKEEIESLTDGPIYQILYESDNSINYRKLLKDAIINQGWDYDAYTKGEHDFCIVHTDALYAAGEIIKDLAQIILDEREANGDFMENLKESLKDFLIELESDKFKHLKK